MRISSRRFRKITATAISVVFLFTNVSNAQEFSTRSTDTLAPEMLSQPVSSLTQEGAVRANQVSDAVRYQEVLLRIGAILIQTNGDYTALLAGLRKDFSGISDPDLKSFLGEFEIDLASRDSVSFSGKEVTVRFSKQGIRGIASICPRDVLEGKKDKRGWEIFGEYALLIGNDLSPREPQEKDLKGDYANDTNPLIKTLIRNGSVIEVSLQGFDKDNAGVLKANKIKWLDNYVPGLTPREIYLREEVDVKQLFTSEEQSNLERWMRKNLIRGEPVKFRVVSGDIGLGWNDDVEHSNIAHAGLRDGAIYIGNLFLKTILKDKNEKIRTAVLDNDEFKHLQAQGHGTFDEYVERKKSVQAVINTENLVEIYEAMAAKDIYHLRDMIRGFLSGNDREGLIRMMVLVNDIVIGQHTAPVEANYPIIKAVALLAKNEKDNFISMFADEKYREYRKLIVVDSIFQALGEIDKMEEWVKTFAPELEGRTVYDVSPEIWHEAGGLARVMQYHGAGILDLLKRSGVRYAQIEPYYQNRMMPDPSDRSKLTAVPFDYTNRKQLTHPIVTELTEIKNGDRPFEVKVGKNNVKFSVFRGVNDLGIEVFLIKDEKGYYTHSLYNYDDGDPNTHEGQFPTWEEFSVFYSKASLEFVKWQENDLKSKLKKDGKNWKAPVLHTNDSQTALISVYKKIQLDEQLERKKKDTGFVVDEVLEDGAVCFTTHTYGNRKDYSRENTDWGDRVLDFMDIPWRYRELFERDMQKKYDIASAGLRAADWQGYVSLAHRNDLSQYDEWVNDVKENPGLKQYYKDMGVEVDLVAVSNGDHRENTTVFFRKYLEEANPGENADPDYPTPDQLAKAKKLAKEKLGLIENKEYFSTKDDGKFIDPEKMVVSYSGRLVFEKIGRGGSWFNQSEDEIGVDGNGAFDNRNIEKMLEKGIQVVIYGNEQTKYENSRKIARNMQKLVDTLKARNYPGRLVFVRRFSLNEQRALLAASDVQIQDSYPRTEAAGFTEADVSACGGIEVGTFRVDNGGLGEGLFQAQGYPMDLAQRGKGNVLTPTMRGAKGYWAVLETLLGKFNSGDLKYYQATSVRLSRALDARVTAAAYLREFNSAILKKAARKEAREKLEKLREKDVEPIRSLWEQIMTIPNKDTDRIAYDKFVIAEKISGGNVAQALELFIKSPVFTGRKTDLGYAADVMNQLIKMYSAGRVDPDYTKGFVSQLAEYSVSLIEGVEADENFTVKENAETAKAVQLMAGQMLTIMSWMDRGVVGAKFIRVTADPDKMAISEKHGNSYIDFNTLPDNVKIRSNSENKPGFFWRGVELVKKLGGNLFGKKIPSENILFSPSRFDATNKKVVMYLMDHGFVKVPDSLREATDANIISTLHETFFINDTLPGSYQTTSTGPGHFQENKLDVKYVTAGSGIQVNVKYATTEGKLEIEEVICQEVKEGDVCFALPGYVDYVVNLGGLRFNDFSIALPIDAAAKFSGYFGEGYAEYKDLISKGVSSEISPFLGAKVGQGSIIINTGKVSTDKVRWGMPLQQYGSAPIFKKTAEGGLIRFYAGMPSQDMLRSIYEEAGRALKEIKEYGTGEMTSHKVLTPEKFMTAVGEGLENKAPTLAAREGILSYCEWNMDFFLKTFGRESAEDRLVRLPVEFLEKLAMTIGAEEVKTFFAEFCGFAREHGFIELYSMSGLGEVADGEYAKYGIHKKDLPDSLKKEKRNRANTVTVFPVFKDSELSANAASWGIGDIDAKDTIVSPIGFNYDMGGLMRSIIFGVRLSVICEKQYTENDEFVTETLAQFIDYYLGQGENPRKFDLTKADLVTLANGNINDMRHILNRIIRLLPITPLNIEELKMIYEHAREAMIRA